MGAVLTSLNHEESHFNHAVARQIDDPGLSRYRRSQIPVNDRLRDWKHHTSSPVDPTENPKRSSKGTDHHLASDSRNQPVLYSDNRSEAIASGELLSSYAEGLGITRSNTLHPNMPTMSQQVIADGQSSSGKHQDYDQLSDLTSRGSTVTYSGSRVHGDCYAGQAHLSEVPPLVTLVRPRRPASFQGGHTASRPKHAQYHQSSPGDCVFLDPPNVQTQTTTAFSDAGRRVHFDHFRHLSEPNPMVTSHFAEAYYDLGGHGSSYPVQCGGLHEAMYDCTIVDGKYTDACKDVDGCSCRLIRGTRQMSVAELATIGSYHDCVDPGLQSTQASYRLPAARDNMAQSVTAMRPPRQRRTSQKPTNAVSPSVQAISCSNGSLASTADESAAVNDKNCLRYKSLTKSLSCYALKFLNLRDRVTGNGDSSRSGNGHSSNWHSKKDNNSFRRDNNNNNNGRSALHRKTNSLLSVESDSQILKEDIRADDVRLNRGDVKRSSREAVNWPTNTDHPSRVRPLHQSFHVRGSRRQNSDRLNPERPLSSTGSGKGACVVSRVESLRTQPHALLSSSSTYSASSQLTDRNRRAHFESANRNRPVTGDFYFQPLARIGTNDILRCLGSFVLSMVDALTAATYKPEPSWLRSLQSSGIIAWIRSIDKALIVQGWSDVAFLNTTHVVFLFMLLKGSLLYEISSERELHSVVMACLYLAYSYLGNEISYPLKPFLMAEINQLIIQNGRVARAHAISFERDGSSVFNSEGQVFNGFDTSTRNKLTDQVRNRFWQYCMQIVNDQSRNMLRIHSDPTFFADLLAELRSHEPSASSMSQSRFSTNSVFVKQR